jgi:hypothetical protein
MQMTNAHERRERDLRVPELRLPLFPQQQQQREEEGEGVTW